MKAIKSKRRNLKLAPQHGFSLIELLIVVAIILIIAAIAIPNLVRARLAANESNAVSSIRSIGTAEIAYNATYNVGYATLTQLGGAGSGCAASATSACLLDNVITSGTKSGYNMDAKPGGTGNTTFVSTATPIVVGITGQRTFCSNQSGPIHFDAAGGAAPGDSAACDAFPLLVQ
jgi:prepilin-type N-terminal cleavage/methylation domain-containing protein